MMIQYSSVTAHSLNAYKNFLKHLFGSIKNVFILSSPIKKKKKKFLKSPHVNKKQKENFFYFLSYFK